MNLLGAKLYDPSSAATKATSALLVMTAFDTTNLRLTVTVPAHGFLFCRMRCQLEGATTFPQVLLGLLVGAAVTARVTPIAVIGATALATTRVSLTAEFVIPGLTPGSTVFDAAYGVEIVVASTNIKYGGPNNTTTDDAWGAFVFELWDPQPLPTAAPGAAGGVFIAGTNAATTITTGLTTTFTGNLTGSVASVTGAVGSVAPGGIAAASFAAGAIDATAIATGAIDADALATDAVNEIADGVWDEATSGHTTAGSTGKALIDVLAFGAPPTANAIADQVWDEALAGHVAAGSAGLALGTAATAAAAAAAGVLTEPIDANLIQIDGLTTNDGAATLNLTQLNVINSGGDAIVAQGSGTGFSSSGFVSGAVFQGLDTGIGVTITGAGDGGVGLYIDSPAEDGIYVNGNRGVAISSQQGHAVNIVANAGDGVHIIGATNTDGINISTFGTGSGIKSVGGDTGHGMHLQGGATSGNGLKAEAQDAGSLDISGPDNDLITSLGVVDADVKKVNGVTVTGDGTLGNEWGPV